MSASILQAGAAKRNAQRTYVATITKLYLTAPEGSEEEELLERVLNIACDRYAIDPEGITAFYSGTVEQLES